LRSLHFRSTVLHPPSYVSIPSQCVSFSRAAPNADPRPDKLKREARHITWSAGDRWNALRRKPNRVRKPTADPENPDVDENPPSAIIDNAEPSSSVESAEGKAIRRHNKEGLPEDPEDNDNTDATQAKANADGEEHGADDEDESTVSAEKTMYRRLFLDHPVPVGAQIRAVLFPSWYTINWLLVAVPVGIALHFVKGMSPLAIFVVNFLAIIPLAGILSFATEEVALRVGEVLGGLLNASFGCVHALAASLLTSQAMPSS
jgi:Ca2+:H+ antiporter